MPVESETHSQLPDEALNAALDDARRRADLLEADIRRLVTDRDATQREAELLEELLRLRDPKHAEGSVASPARGSNREPHTKRGPHPAVRESIAELQRSQRPMRISELMESLEARGISIPGAGEQANLIALLSRAEEIVRPSRGMYALAAWDAKQVPLKPARKARVGGTRKSTQVRGEKRS